MSTIVSHWKTQRALAEREGLTVELHLMSAQHPSRVLTLDGTTVILLNARLSLSDRLAELQRQRFVLSLHRELDRTG